MSYGFLHRFLNNQVVICFPFLLVVLTSFYSTSAFSQSNLLDFRMELDNDAEFTYQNIIYSRSINEGKFLIESYYLRLPNEEYKELSVGGGYNLYSNKGMTFYLLGHIAFASDENYFQPALLAFKDTGRFTWSIFLLYYAPLGQKGISQWLIDPFELQYEISRKFSIGTSTYAWKSSMASVYKNGIKIGILFGSVKNELAVRYVSPNADIEVQFRALIFF